MRHSSISRRSLVTVWSGSPTWSMIATDAGDQIHSSSPANTLPIEPLFTQICTPVQSDRAKPSKPGNRLASVMCMRLSWSNISIRLWAEMTI